MNDKLGKITACFTFCILLGSSFLALVPQVKAVSIVYVDDNYYDGGQNDGHQWGVDAFSTITAGITNVDEGGTVYVHPGTYPESIEINKQVSVIGDNKNDVTVRTFRLFKNWITLREMSVSGGIFLAYANNCTVDNCIVQSNAAEGIRLFVAPYNTITNNIIRQNSKGISLQASQSGHAVIKYNTVYQNTNDGIYIEAADNCTVEYNDVYSNGNGITTLVSATDNIIQHNDVHSNSVYGISLYNCYRDTIAYNNVTNNNYGFYLVYSTHDNTIRDNTVTGNSIYGMYIVLGDRTPYYNTIYNNYFNNPGNAFDQGTNFWNIEKTSGTNIIGGPYLGGNYFSDYTGYDSNADGLGETPYFISGGSNQDLLPLTTSSSPPAPQIQFATNPTQHTITVTAVSPSGIPWEDISNVGSGSCTLPTGTIDPADIISNCYGTVSLEYLPTTVLLFTYQFSSPETPQITFTTNQVQHTLTVVSVSPSGIPWSTIQNAGSGTCQIPPGTIDPSDVLISCFGTIRLVYTPTQILLAEFQFPEAITPQITFTADQTQHTLVVTSITPDNINWDDIMNIGSGSCYFPEGIVRAGDRITSCFGSLRFFYNPTQVVLTDFVFSLAITPTLVFVVNQQQRTLTVVAIDIPNIPWNDIFATGSITIPGGTIEVGDIMTDGYGTVSIGYRPNGVIISTFEFSQPTIPQISFTADYDHSILMVSGIGSFGILWSDIRNTGGGNCVFPSGTVEPGDSITDCSGTVTLVYTPSEVVLATFEFTQTSPQFQFSYNIQQNTITIVSAPLDQQYSEGVHQNDANLVFKRWTYSQSDYDADAFVLNSLQVGRNNDLSTKTIEAGDVLSGFSNGYYQMIWQPSNQVLFEFTVSTSAEEYPLMVYAQDPINEGTLFQISTLYLDAEQGRLMTGQVTISFDEKTYTTDSYGTLFIQAPFVNQDTLYQITGSKTGFKTAIKEITVENTGDVSYGWVHGNVYWNNNGAITPSDGVFVEILLPNEETMVASTTTTTEGIYSITVPIGSYRVFVCDLEHNKQSDKKTVTVEYQESVQVDFIIDISNSIPVQTTETQGIIQEAIRKGDLGGEMIVQQQADQTFGYTINIYNTVQITPVEIVTGKLSFLVSGNEQSLGKTIAITIDRNLFNDIDELAIEYDGEPIAEASNITDITNPNDDGSHAEYLAIIDSNGQTSILFSFPHFSVHSISIQSIIKVVEALGGVIAVIVYVVIICVAVAAYGVPIWIFRKRKMRNN